MGAAARRLTDLDQQGYVDVVDEGLVRRARGGDQQAMDQIISRYRGFVRLKASAYFLAGGDSEGGTVIPVARALRFGQAS